MKERHKVIPRSLCFIKNEDSYLFIKYSGTKWSMAWYYNCPGWHIELGEGIIENAMKEIEEETWIQMNETKLKWVIHIDGFFGKDIMLFVTLSHTQSWVTQESEEWTLHWMKKDELTWIKLMEDVKIILEKIESLNDTEVFTAKSSFDGEWKLLRLDFE